MVFVIHWHVRPSRDGLKGRHTMMAVSMCAHAAVVALGKLMIAALAFTHHIRRHGGRGFSCRFARDRIDCSTEHRAEQQQQSRKAPNASPVESKDHRG
jgi:hypothetical protein